MKRIRTFITLALLLALAVMDAPKAQRQDTTEETHRFSHTTKTQIYDFITEGATTTARLRVVVKLTTGRATWKLLDPQGNAHLSGVCEGGRVTSDTQDFHPAVTGGWKLQLELQDASGDYRIHWVTR